MKWFFLSLLFLISILDLLLLGCILTSYLDNELNTTLDNASLLAINGSSENRQDINGIVTNIWLEPKSRMDLFRIHNIKYLIVDVGNTDKDGTLNTPPEQISSFISLARSYENETQTRFILLAYSEINTDNYDITNQTFQTNYLDMGKQLVGYGFDGVLVDIEPVPSHKRAAYLDILHSLRSQLPPESIIAVYTGTMAENSTNPWDWNYDFFSEVGKIADILSIQGYDTGLTTGDEYKNFLKDQVSKFSRYEWHPIILFGTPTHNPSPETISNALTAYNEAFQATPNPNFLGIIIFADWTTDDNEWAAFSDYLNTRSGPQTNKSIDNTGDNR